MDEISLNDDLVLRITILTGGINFQTAKLISVFPHLVADIEIQNSKVTALTRRIIDLQQSDSEVENIQQLIMQRDNLIIDLSRLACIDIVPAIKKWRSLVDTILTLLFTTSTFLYLWSICAGLAVDAVLVTLLWFSNRLFTDRFHTVQEHIWEENNVCK